jgi:hypothetical protein
MAQKRIFKVLEITKIKNSKENSEENSRTREQISNAIMSTCTKRIRDDGEETLVIKRHKVTSSKLNEDGLYDDASGSVKLVPALELKQEGRFFVTDPCYFFGEKFWDAHVKVLFDTRYEEIQSFLVDGINIYVGSTKYGDGAYEVREQLPYGDTKVAGKVDVDAGMIAMFPLSFIKSNCMEAAAEELVNNKHGCYVDMDRTPVYKKDKWWLGSKHFIDYVPVHCEYCSEYCDFDVQEWDDDWGTVCGCCLDEIREEREEKRYQEEDTDEDSDAN